MKATLPERILCGKTEAAGFYGIHDPKACMGQWCVFHDPSNHHMRSWKKGLRGNGLVERLCPHGVGHPDPDSAAFMRRRHGDAIYAHGCDGCCQSDEETIFAVGLGEVTITIIRA